MAAPATLNTLIAGAKCFDCLSDSEKRAALVVFLALALKALGGTDLTNINTLRNAAVNFNNLPDPRLKSFDVEIAQNLANNVGAAANLTIAQLKTKIACFCGGNLGPVDLHGLETYLRNQLAALNA